MHNVRGGRLMLSVVATVFVLLMAACSSGAQSADRAEASTPFIPEPTASTMPSTEASTTEASTTEASTTEASTTEASTEALAGEPGVCSGLSPGVTQLNVAVGAASYPVQVYVPSSYDQTLLPAVINWHGLGSDGQEQASFTDYEKLAEAEGFLVAHPTGLSTEISIEALGWELQQFDVAGRDDLAMAAALIDLLISDFCADSARIYTTGMSNGGFFTSWLVCELADRIAAAVSVAGLTHHEGCEPSRAVPYLAFHGTSDRVVPFAGGESTLTPAGAAPELVAFFEQVMPTEFAEFAADFGCDAEPSVENVSPEVIRYDYNKCADGVEASFVEIVDGGHTWPGSPFGPLIENLVGLTTDDISATVDGWQFMRQFSLPE